MYNSNIVKRKNQQREETFYLHFHWCEQSCQRIFRQLFADQRFHPTRSITLLDPDLCYRLSGFSDLC